MSFAEKIAKAREEAALVSANVQMSVYQLMKLYKEDQVMYVCKSGRVVDMIIEKEGE